MITDKEIAAIKENIKKGHLALSSNMSLAALITALESSRTAHAAETAALERAVEFVVRRNTTAAKIDKKEMLCYFRGEA